MADREGEVQEPHRRRFYAGAFLVALAIEVLLVFLRGGEVRPTLIGLAVMITAALFFLYSWVKQMWRNSRG